MTTDPPAPGSQWATHCADAYPADWFEALGLTALPSGFARFATAEECALIAGTGTPPTPRTRSERNGKNPSAGERLKPPLPKPESRFAVLNSFVDCEMHKLTRAEVAVWFVLYRDTKPDGTARTGQTDLARRAGCDARTVRRAITLLEARGLVEVIRRGQLGTGPSRYRVCGTGHDPPE